MRNNTSTQKENNPKEKAMKSVIKAINVTSQVAMNRKKIASKSTWKVCMCLMTVFLPLPEQPFNFRTEKKGVHIGLSMTFRV